MIVEGGLAEFERHRIGGLEENRIGPEARQGGHEDCTRHFQGRIEQFSQLARGDARHVARDGEEAPRPAGERRSLGMGDGFRVAAVGLLAECARPVAPRQRLDRRVTRDDQHQADLRAGQRVEDVFEHGARKFAALGR